MTLRPRGNFKGHNQTLSLRLLPPRAELSRHTSRKLHVYAEGCMLIENNATSRYESLVIAKGGTRFIFMSIENKKH